MPWQKTEFDKKIGESCTRKAFDMETDFQRYIMFAIGADLINPLELDFRNAPRTVLNAEESDIMGCSAFLALLSKEIKQQKHCKMAQEELIEEAGGIDIWITTLIVLEKGRRMSDILDYKLDYSGDEPRVRSIFSTKYKKEDDQE